MLNHTALTLPKRLLYNIAISTDADIKAPYIQLEDDKRKELYIKGSVEIIEVTQISDDLVSAFGRLIPQLSSSSLPPTEVELKEIISSPSTVLFVAKENSRNGEIVGTLVLVLSRIPTRVRAWIEDVVVDSEYRGNGIGEELNQVALRRAARAGARTVDLPSRPSRKDANRLYSKLGFIKRETNVYRYEFK